MKEAPVRHAEVTSALGVALSGVIDRIDFGLVGPEQVTEDADRSFNRTSWGQLSSALDASPFCHGHLDGARPLDAHFTGSVWWTGEHRNSLWQMEHLTHSPCVVIFKTPRGQYLDLGEPRADAEYGASGAAVAQ